MAKRRISIPEDHVALVLSNQLADELLTIMRGLRQVSQRGYLLVEATNSADGTGDPSVKDSHAQAHAHYRVAGDVMLALIEAKEA